MKLQSKHNNKEIMARQSNMQNENKENIDASTSMLSWIKYAFYFCMILVFIEYLTFDFENETLKPSYYLSMMKDFLINKFHILGMLFAYVSEKIITWFNYNKFFASLYLIFSPVIESLFSLRHVFIGYFDYVKGHISIGGLIYFGSGLIILLIAYLGFKIYRRVSQQ